MSSQLWGTEEAEKINYDFIGTNCETTENYFLEVGEGGIYKGKIMTEWIKDIEPTEDFHSESNLGIITWDIPDETYFFTHQAKRVKAEIWKEMIIIEELKNGFIISKNQTQNPENKGIPRGAVKLENEASCTS